MNKPMPAAPPRSPPNRILLLYSDRTDAVSRVLLEQSVRFGREVVAMSLRQLVEEVEPGVTWTWLGRTFDPARTAVVNRLVSIEAPGDMSPLASTFQRQQFACWLHDELRRFAYASSLPTAMSPLGDHGSLLDQWSDIPPLVGGMRVPIHQTSPGQQLRGDVCAVDPARLYSLGQRVDALPAPDVSGKLLYVRPHGPLFHVAQVGSLFIVANAPPQMTKAQQDYVMRFVKAMSEVSTSRILEHAFFVGDELPVFYSTCPVPVIVGRLPEYPNLVVEGLLHDIENRRQRAAA
jgi:hypothetical protein